MRQTATAVAEAPDQGRCQCPKVFDLTYLKRGVHDVLRRRPILEPTALSSTPAYQKGQIARSWTDFQQLITSNPLEEPVQKFIEKTRSFDHSSSHSASSISPPSSQGKKPTSAF
jgi:hypothetical protein